MHPNADFFVTPVGQIVPEVCVGFLELPSPIATSWGGLS